MRNSGLHKTHYVDFKLLRDVNESGLPGKNDPAAVGVGYCGGQYHQHVHVRRPMSHCRPGLNNRHFSQAFQLGMGRISGLAAAVGLGYRGGQYQ